MNRIRALLAATVLALAPMAVTNAAYAEDIPSFDFTDCPDLPDGSIPRQWVCSVAIVNDGRMVLGKFNQQITSPIQFTFATGLDPKTHKQVTVFGRLRADKMLVQPGIFGDPILTAVYAQPQYAGAFDVKSTPQGTVWALALKLRVINPVLGPNCRLGRDSQPISLNLAITKPPVIVQPSPVVTKAEVADITFAVPGANNCGLNLGLLNAVVNLQAGTPSAAGKNSATFVQYLAFKKYTDLIS